MSNGEAAMSSVVPGTKGVVISVLVVREDGEECKDPPDSQQSRRMRMSAGASSSRDCSNDHLRPGIGPNSKFAFLRL